MTTDTLTLTRFLLERIADDEALASAAADTNGTDWASEELSYGCGEVGVFGSLEPGHSRAYRGSGDFGLWDNEGALGMSRGTAEHIARHDPARVLAECKFKRAIVVGHSPLHVCVNIADDGQTDYSDDESDLGYAPCPTLRALAAVHADHPAFNPDWS